MFYEQYFVFNLISHTLVHINFAFIQDRKKCLHASGHHCMHNYLSVALFHLNYDTYLLRHTVHKDLKYCGTLCTVYGNYLTLSLFC